MQNQSFSDRLRQLSFNKSDHRCLQQIRTMEETIRKLKQFIQQIFIAEAEADVFRIKLFVTPGSKRKVFQAIDDGGVGSIMYDDICTYCDKEGLIIPEGDWEIVGRYFRNWHKGITFDQFCQILNPKNLLAPSQEDNQLEAPTSTFLNLITTVVNSYKELELIREELSLNSDLVIYHFEDCYRSGRGFSKDSLKTFMVNQNIYTKQKFLLVAGYIFGEIQSKIPWVNFFSEKIKVSVPEQFVGESEAPCAEEVEQKPQPSSQAKSKYKIPKSCENIQEVLDQIEQIEKNLKQKKVKCQKKMVNDQKVIQKKSPLIGKVVSRQKNPKKQQNQDQTYVKPVTFVKQTKYYDIPDYTSKPLQRKKQLSYNASVGNFKRCASEAQMKIQQIERRAMDKYLNNRRGDYLPVDTHIPYYHDTRETRQSHQFGRWKNSENYNVGRIVPTHSKRLNPNFQIYSRHNISRAWLYDSNEINYFTRPVSPRLLRY